MAGEVVVELEHWTHPRLPPGHSLSERWTLSSSGRAVLTFGTEIEARAAARQYGWTVRPVTASVLRAVRG